MVTWGTSPEDVVSVKGTVPNPSSAKTENKKKSIERSLEYMGLKPGTKITDIKLDKNFPMIKCNINRRGKKLFFLPFDKFYDRVHIEKKKGEFYTDSINECIKKGFKYVGKN